jgi:DNA-binding NtrC family response regulator
MISIFIVDDDPNQANMLKEFISNSEYNIQTFTSGEDCIKNLGSNPDIIFLDYHFDLLGPNAMNGIDILKEIKSRNPKVDVVMISSQDKIEVAMNTMKFGAFDYIVKGETAFHRAENAINNISNRIGLKSQVSTYKRLAWSFGLAAVIGVIATIIIFKLIEAGHY